MNVISKFTLRTFIGPFLITFVVILFLLLMQFVWKYVDDMVGKGLEWYVIAELLFYTSASLVPLALPLAVLLSAIMTYGKMGEQYELIAFKSSGISLMRIMRPLMVMNILLAIGAFFFANNVIPVANLKSGSLLWDITRKKPAFNLKEGVFYNGIEGYSIKVAEKYGENNNQLKDVLIYDHTESRGNTKVIRAKHGEMYVMEEENFLAFKLYDGYSYEELRPKDKTENQRQPHLKFQFSEQIILFDLSNFSMARTDEMLFKNDYRMMNIVQLDRNSDSLKLRLDTVLSTFNDRLVTKYTFVYPDSIASKRTAIYPLLSSFESGAQERIIRMATNLARNSKSYINSHVSEFRWKREYITRHIMEKHKKFTLPLACVILFFVGAPLGAIIRKGGMGMPVIVAVMIFIVYHVMNTMMEKLGREMSVSPFFAIWTSSLFFLPLGFWLTYKSTTDSTLFNIDVYLEPFRKLFTRKRK